MERPFSTRCCRLTSSLWNFMVRAGPLTDGVQGEALTSLLRAPFG